MTGRRVLQLAVQVLAHDNPVPISVTCAYEIQIQTSAFGNGMR